MTDDNKALNAPAINLTAWDNAIKQPTRDELQATIHSLSAELDTARSLARDMAEALANVTSGWDDEAKRQLCGDALTRWQEHEGKQP